MRRRLKGKGELICIFNSHNLSGFPKVVKKISASVFVSVRSLATFDLKRVKLGRIDSESLLNILYKKPLLPEVFKF